MTGLLHPCLTIPSAYLKPLTSSTCKQLPPLLNQASKHPASSECDREEPVLLTPHQGFHQRLAGQLLHNGIGSTKYWMKPKRILLMIYPFTYYWLFILMVTVKMAARLVLREKNKPSTESLPTSLWLWMLLFFFRHIKIDRMQFLWTDGSNGNTELMPESWNGRFGIFGQDCSLEMTGFPITPPF